MKTCELIGPALDWAAAKCEEPLGGYKAWVQADLNKGIAPAGVRADDWLTVGPIIEREWIEIVPWPNESDEDMRWRATQHDTAKLCSATGPTPLIAAMRCYVASKLGDNVDIPKELT